MTGVRLRIIAGDSSYVTRHKCQSNCWTDWIASQFSRKGRSWPRKIPRHKEKFAPNQYASLSGKSKILLKSFLRECRLSMFYGLRPLLIRLFSWALAIGKLTEKFQKIKATVSTWEFVKNFPSFLNIISVFRRRKFRIICLLGFSSTNHRCRRKESDRLRECVAGLCESAHSSFFGFLTILACKM